MNVGEWISKRALVRPDRPLIKDGDRELNNLEFDRAVNRAAHALASLGLTKGDRLSVLMDNSIEFLEIFFACAKLGLIFTPLGVQLAVPDLKFMLGDAAPKVLVYGPIAEKNIAALRPDFPRGPKFIPLGADHDPEGLLALAASASEAAPVPASEVDDDDPFLIIYVPGLSGDPKGAVLSHDNILFGAINSILGFGLDQTYRSLVVAPLSQIGALTASAATVIYAGGSLALKSFYNPSEIVETIVREKITFMFAVPVMFQMMAKAPEWSSADFSHVHHFIAGGAPMPVDVIRKYQEEKNIHFVQGYGMTETGRLTALDIEDSRRKAGSVGKEVFHVQLRIVDDDGAEVPRGEIGEVIVRGPNVFREYWKRPEDNKKSLRDGWFYTADLGRRDEEGFIYLEGRKVETIISSGRNIYPAEVTRVLLTVPGVREAVVVGLPDPGKGQVVGAAVVGDNLTKDGILAFMEGRLAAYKTPKRMLILDAIPKIPIGFPDKDKIRKMMSPEG
ncbi:MAG: AMP-binding protein [Pseudomonadota bacterium]